MNYRQKSKQKGKWAFIKYFGDEAIYATCQNCGYTYCSSKAQVKNGFKITLLKPHRYCPNCGLKMGLFDNNTIYKMKEDGTTEITKKYEWCEGENK